MKGSLDGIGVSSVMESLDLERLTQGDEATLVVCAVGLIRSCATNEEDVVAIRKVKI